MIVLVLSVVILNTAYQFTLAIVNLQIDGPKLPNFSKTTFPKLLGAIVYSNLLFLLDRRYSRVTDVRCRRTWAQFQVGGLGKARARQDGASQPIYNTFFPCSGLLCTCVLTDDDYTALHTCELEIGAVNTIRSFTPMTISL